MTVVVTRRGRKKWRDFLVEVLGSKCKECGSTEILEVDHIIPIGKGGKDELANLQVLCKDCHRKKTLGDTNLTPQQAAKRLLTLRLYRKAKRNDMEIDERTLELFRLAEDKYTAEKASHPIIPPEDTVTLRRKDLEEWFNILEGVSRHHQLGPGLNQIRTALFYLISDEAWNKRLKAPILAE